MSSTKLTVFGAAQHGESITAAGVLGGSQSISKGAEYSDFFSRPIVIYNGSWTLGNPFNLNVGPWSLWRLNANVAKKIAGFSRFRGRLHLKFVATSTPFQFGKLLVSYKPLSNSANGDYENGDYSGGVINGGANKIMGRSQRHSLELDAQDSPEAEMVLPFIYNKEWFLSEATLTQWLTLGKLSIDSFGPLRSVGTAATGEVDITIFAWMEDIELDGPSYYPQSDEYESKPVSTAATAVADMAGVLSMVPDPRVSAVATNVQAASRMVASVASAMGYSAPHVVADDVVVRNRTIPNTANTSVGSAFEMLSLDPKNGLTSSDSMAGGSGDDELCLTSLCSRPSYWFKSSWTTANTSGLELARWNVTPQCFTVETIPLAGAGTVSAVSMTPSCFVSQNFQFWRGTMEYTIKIPHTKFHQGKLRITYEPNLLSLRDPALQRNFIMDLGQDQEITFTIPYMAPSAYLGCLKLIDHPINGVNFTINGTAPTSYSVEAFNGVVAINVLNALSAPVDSTVDVLVFARMLDAEFAAPISTDAPSSSYGFGFDITDVDPYWTQSEETDLGVTKLSPNTTTYMGERVLSLRTLLERTLWGEYRAYKATSDVTGVALYKRTLPRFPRGPGLAAPRNTAYGSWGTSISVTGGQRGYVFSPMHPMNYVTSAFVGWRGSVRWRFRPTFYSGVTGAGAPLSKINMTLTREPAGFNYGANGNMPETLGVYTNTVSSSKLSWYQKQAHKNFSGSAIADCSVEPVIHASVPMYSKCLMLPANPLVYADDTLWTSAGGVNTDSSFDNMVVTAEAQVDLVNGKPVFTMESYVSAGTDFSPLTFLNVPTFYVVPTSAFVMNAERNVVSVLT